MFFVPVTSSSPRPHKAPRRAADSVTIPPRSPPPLHVAPGGDSRQRAAFSKKLHTAPLSLLLSCFLLCDYSRQAPHFCLSTYVCRRDQASFPTTPTPHTPPPPPPPPQSVNDFAVFTRHYGPQMIGALSWMIFNAYHRVPDTKTTPSSCSLFF